MSNFQVILTFEILEKARPKMISSPNSSNCYKDEGIWKCDFYQKMLCPRCQVHQGFYLPD